MSSTTRRAAEVAMRSTTGRATTIVVAIVVALGGLASPLRAERRSSATFDARQVVALTNESRREAGLAPVVVDKRLTAAAKAKLFDMLKGDYFAHRTPDGRQPWAFMRAAGYRFQMAAENLAKGYDDEPELQRAWMKSRGHRANILNPQFTDIGVADANGVVVVMFGRPAPPTR